MSTSLAPLGLVLGLALTLAASGCDSAAKPPDVTNDATDSQDALPDAITPADTLADADALADAPSDTDPDSLADAPSDTDPDSLADTDPDTTGPTPLPVEPAIVGTLATGSWRWVIVVDPTTLVASDGDVIWWLSGASTSPIAASPDAALPSPFIPPEAVTLGPGDVLLAGAHGLTRIRDGLVTPTPLTARFEDEPIFTLAAESAPSTAFWLSTGTGLYRWSSDALTPYSASGVSLANNRLAFGAPFSPDSPSTTPSLWLSGPHGTSALRLAPLAFGLERPPLTAPPVVDLGADRDGNLYVLANANTADAGTSLHIRRPDSGRGLWTTFELPVRDLTTHPDASAAWLVLDDGRLARGAGTRFAEVAPLPAALTSPRHLAMHADGRLVAATSAGLFEVSANRTLTLVGLPLAPLTTTTTVAARLSDPGAVATATARVMPADLAIPVAITGSGGARELTLTLDPLALPNGTQTLTLTVTWDDDETLTTSALFSVDLPAWTDEVKPFFDRNCSNCHGADNGGNFASLHTPAAWSARMDEILCRVDAHAPAGTKPIECAVLGMEVASMPPGRIISTTNVQMLRLWRDAGFRP